ncbi:hypothetical protein M413DRAFT_17178 [Hebeloma cylindrosporum]|uniref:Ams2/SPT21 N-terminal domain-containing protein n=1 Tax=Hebeloma cylindrosporum TaxID=76867 RepID=A0A0C2Y5C9_HEBCY|nr:hypothetical protein M413DRAFT_17178 [Hebeloma cylindrosporum h7]
MATWLRVLYTINSSPQNILARSHVKIPVSLISPDHIYANVSLKTCLDTICRSSPELTQDTSRDFSLYVLDPLESNSAPPPVNIPNAGQDASASNPSSSKEQPRGVAVGLGLMSRALNADDSDGMTVVGTLVKQPNGQQALEVIFALREVYVPHSNKNQPLIMYSWGAPPSSQDSSTSNLPLSQGESKQNLWQLSSQPSSSSNVDSTRDTLASIQLRAKSKIKPAKPVRQSTIPITESDKLMNADTYIGPLKKKGRPKTTNPETRPPTTQCNAVASGPDFVNTAKEVIVIDGSDSDVTLPTPPSSIFRKTTAKPLKPPKSAVRKNKPELNSPFTTDPLVRRVPDQEPNLSKVEVKVEPQEQPTLLDVFAYFSATASSEPNAQNAAILAALSTIDSSASEGSSGTNAAHNPALMSALKQLLSVCATAAPANPPEPIQHHQRTSSGSQDDGIVVLDKENVNPKASQKGDPPNVKFSAQVSGVPPSSSNLGSGQGSQHERQKQRLGPSARSNENLFRTTSLKESVLASGTERVVRKRTLSDFMDEKENGKSKGKGKERERVEKRESSRHSQQSQRLQRTTANDSLRHYPRLVASDQPRAEQPSNYYRTPLESWTSPARPPQNRSDEQSPERPNPVDLTSSTPPQTKVPSPRAQRESASSPVRGKHQGVRKKYVVPEWARTSTSTQPRLSEEAQRALEELEEKKRLERIAARKRLPSMQQKSKGKPPTFESASSSGDQQKNQGIAPPKQNASEGLLAVGNDRPLVAFANISFPFISSRSSSPPPNASILPRTPKTPTREKPNLQSTSGRESESLFTPIMGSGSLFGSVHSSYQQTPSLPTVLTSPLGNRKKARISPMGLSSFAGRRSREPSSWSNVSSSEDNKPSDLPSSSKPGARRIEESRDELDCPPSSLPIASSDFDIDEPCPQTADSTLDEDDHTETLPIKQHWAGLPPSSPPAPSSPMVFADDLQTDDEMDDIPIATSDSEADAEMSGRETDITSPACQSPSYLQGDFTNAFTDADFSALFPSNSTSSSQQSSVGVIDVFEQFTNLDSHSNGSMPSTGEGAGQTDSELEAMFRNGLDGMDFTEFWETFKPRVQDSTQTIDVQEDAGFGNFFDLGRDDPLASFGEIDHTKLADDMQALLSGCLM